MIDFVLVDRRRGLARAALLIGICATLLTSRVGAFVAVPATSKHSSRLQSRRGWHSLQASNTTSAEAVSPILTEEDAASALLSQGDPSVDAPLPPAYSKCPFSGILGGPQSFYRVASQALNSPSLFSFLQKGQPIVEVSGGDAVRNLLKQEFSALKSNAIVGVSQYACGTESLRTVLDKEEHKVVRDLVGVPLSASAVSASIPRLEAICQRRIHEMLTSRPAGSVVKAIDVTQAMALDVAWQQVLGLDLQTREEIETFHVQAYTWLRGLYSRHESPEFQAMLTAREYLVQAVEKKIEQLQRVGKSDGSTVGGLLFATMDDVEDATESSDNRHALTQQEVIDNALLLILAATETTSSNLANSIMMMGLHSNVWDKVVEEQRSVVKEHGAKITKEIIDDHCPYLTAVIQETLRILPVTLVSRREVAETIVIDNQQIPKGWGVSYNIFLTHQGDEALAAQDGGDPMDLETGFRPSRWLDSSTRPGKEYVPFGAGPRKCPGILLAKTEMKTFLALFARSVRYELAAEIDKNKPIDSQIEWKQLNSVPIPESGVEMRVLE